MYDTLARKSWQKATETSFPGWKIEDEVVKMDSERIDQAAMIAKEKVRSLFSILFLFVLLALF